MTAPHEIALIAALDRDGWIGREGRLLCHLPLDLKHFKQLTLGQPVIMGRKTCASLGQRPLPGRTNIVLTRQHAAAIPGFVMAHDVESAVRVAQEALASAAASDHAFAATPRSIWIIGGAEIYALFLSRATRMELTRVEAALPGDVRFPEVPWQEWKRSSAESHDADERHAHPFRFETWLRA